MRIWLDAHATPPSVRELVYQAAVRDRIPVVLVGSGAVPVPRSPFISAVKVGRNMEPQDHYLVANPSDADLVVTDSLMLAEALLAKGITVLHPRGEEIGPDAIAQWPISLGDSERDAEPPLSARGDPREVSPKQAFQFETALAAWIERSLPPR